MMPSRYEPGDEPDECYCAEHGRVKPCSYCRFDAMCDRYDEDRKERRDAYWDRLMDDADKGEVQ